MDAAGDIIPESRKQEVKKHLDFGTNQFNSKDNEVELTLKKKEKRQKNLHDASQEQTAAQQTSQSLSYNASQTHFNELSNECDVLPSQVNSCDEGSHKKKKKKKKRKVTETRASTEDTDAGTNQFNSNDNEVELTLKKKEKRQKNLHDASQEQTAAQQTSQSLSYNVSQTHFNELSNNCDILPSQVNSCDEGSHKKKKKKKKRKVTETRASTEDTDAGTNQFNSNDNEVELTLKKKEKRRKNLHDASEEQTAAQLTSQSPSYNASQPLFNELSNECDILPSQVNSCDEGYHKKKKKKKRKETETQAYTEYTETGTVLVAEEEIPEKRKKKKKKHREMSGSESLVTKVTEAKQSFIYDANQSVSDLNKEDPKRKSIARSYATDATDAEVQETGETDDHGCSESISDSDRHPVLSSQTKKQKRNRKCSVGSKESSSKEVKDSASSVVTSSVQISPTDVQLEEDLELSKKYSVRNRDRAQDNSSFVEDSDVLSDSLTTSDVCLNSSEKQTPRRVLIPVLSAVDAAAVSDDPLKTLNSYGIVSHEFWEKVTDLLSEKGVKLSFHSGKWSPVERKLLKSNIDRFLETHELPFGSLCNLLGVGNSELPPSDKLKLKVFINETKFKVLMGEGIKRRLPEIYYQARDTLMHSTSGCFDEEETKLVQDQKVKHGHEWACLAFELNRTRSSVSKRAASLESPKDKRKGRWTDDEDNLLRACLIKYTGVDKPSTGTKIPWTQIALQIGSRNALQCKKHWEETVMGKRKVISNDRFLKSDKLKLVQLIEEQNPELQSDIDWAALEDRFNGRFNVPKIQKSWQKMKKTLIDPQSKSIQDVISKLKQKYAT